MTHTKLRLSVLALCIIGSASAGFGLPPVSALSILLLAFIAFDSFKREGQASDQARRLEKLAKGLLDEGFELRADEYATRLMMAARCFLKALDRGEGADVARRDLEEEIVKVMALESVREENCDA